MQPSPQRPSPQPHEDTDALDRRLRSLAGRLVQDECAADDLVQEAWLASLSTPQTHVADRGAWLGAVLRNLSSRRFGRSARRRQVEELWAPPESQDPDLDEVERRSTRAWLEEQLAQLREPYRAVLDHHYFQGLTISETASLLVRPFGAVKSQIHRVLRELRSQLDTVHPEGRAAWSLLLLRFAGPDGTPAPESVFRLAGPQPAAPSLGPLLPTLAIGGFAVLVLAVVLSPQPEQQTSAELPALAGQTAESPEPEGQVQDAIPGSGVRAPGDSTSQVAQVETADPSAVVPIDSVAAIDPGEELRSVFVTVRGTDGQLAREFVVEAWGEVYFLGEFWSDESGVARIDVKRKHLAGPPRLPPDQPGVILTARVLGDQWTSKVHLPVPREGRDIELASPGPGRQVHISVVDDQGVPIEAAYVGFEENQWAETVAEDGSYVFASRSYSRRLPGATHTWEGFPLRPYRVVARTPVHGPQRLVIDAYTDPLHLDFVLDHGVLLHGTLQLEDGSPAAGARVWVRNVTGKVHNEPLPETYADEFGHYELTGLGEELSRVLVTDATGERFFADTIIDGRGHDAIEWSPVLVPPAPFTVLVLENGGIPAAGVDVLVAGIEEPAWSTTGHTGPDGRAHFPNVSRTESLSIYCARSFADDPGVATIAYTEKEVTVELPDPSEPKGSAVGVLLDHSGQPFPEALLLGTSEPGMTLQTRSDPETGAFAFENLPARPFRLWTAIPGYGAVFWDRRQVHGGEQLDFGILHAPPTMPVAFDWTAVNPSAEEAWAIFVLRLEKRADEKTVYLGSGPIAELALFPGKYRLSSIDQSQFLVDFEVTAAGTQPVRVTPVGAAAE